MGRLTRRWARDARRAAWLGLGLLFQRPCAACQKRVADPREAGLCPACWKDLESWPVPAVRTHLEEEPDFSALAAFPYEGWVRELVHAWKFEGRSALTRPLAKVLARRLAARAEASFDLVVALPPNPVSLKERGFDASGELARLAARELALPLLAPLKQRRERSRQSGLKRLQRLKNVEGLYEVAEPAQVEGKNVLLLDDLMTTGASAQAAAAALLDAGARSVTVGVLAHAVGA